MADNLSIDRTAIFDKVLQRLYDKKDYFVTVPEYIEEVTGTDNHQLAVSICEELTERSWATPSNYDKRTMQITFDGQQIIEKYKSYSSFLRLENKSLHNIQTLNNVNRTLNIIYKIGTIVFGISTVIFAYFSYIDKQELKEKDQTISRQQTVIDSLRQILDRQQKAIDSLSHRTDTTKTK